jgi:hypothetical protein
MPLSTILLVLLVLLLVGAFPRAGAYNAGWGYWPSGLVGLVLAVVIIMALLGRL